MPNNVFDGIEGLPRGGIPDGVDVDLQAEIVDPLGGRGPAQRFPSHSCTLPWLGRPEQYGAGSAPVSFSTTPSAKNFTVSADSSGEPVARTRSRAAAKWVTCVSKWRGSA